LTARSQAPPETVDSSPAGIAVEYGGAGITVADNEVHGSGVKGWAAGLSVSGGQFDGLAVTGNTVRDKDPSGSNAFRVAGACGGKIRSNSLLNSAQAMRLGTQDGPLCDTSISDNVSDLGVEVVADCAAATCDASTRPTQ
jgi:hypothetical protein